MPAFEEFLFDLITGAHVEQFGEFLRHRQPAVRQRDDALVAVENAKQLWVRFQSHQTESLRATSVSQADGRRTEWFHRS